MAPVTRVPAIALLLLSGFIGAAPAGNLPLNAGYAAQSRLKSFPQTPSIAAGWDRTCAATSSGDALCWGDNTSGALGNDSIISNSLPSPVVSLSSGVTAIATGASSYHSCAITSAGGVVCWGNNDDGEVGNGTTAPATVPASVTGLSSGVKALATGNFHTCALTVFGEVLCWGGDEAGELGDGNYGTNSTVPIPVGLPSAVAAITAGTEHTCAVTVAGGVWCWGRNSNGQLGDGTTTDSAIPVAVSGLSTGVVAIAAGFYHTCALTGTGSVLCWGYNDDGQVGAATITNRSVPLAVAGLPPGTTQIATGGYHTCALNAGGEVSCWGNNANGELGNGTVTNSSTPVAVAPLPAGVVGLALGWAHSCAITSAGTVLCWGYNGAGQLGNGTHTSSSTPTPSTGLTVPVVSITAGELHTCALTAAGGVLCWGANDSFELGNGEVVGIPTPTQVTGLTSGVTALSSGVDHSCALQSTGAVSCWGFGAQGQLGNGFFGSKSVPVATSITAGAVAITSGQFHACALTSAGGVLCWGYNGDGSVGDGTTTNRATPVAVTGLSSGVTAISAGWHTCALTVGGGVQCWGYNVFGELGNGSNDHSSVPVPVTGLSSGIVAIAAGAYHTCALTRFYGVVLCWGENTYGQLGNGTFDDSSVPVAVPGLSSVIAITAGNHHTCALTSAGSVQCWGQNFNGQLGTGTTVDSLVPVAVSGLPSGLASIVAGSHHTCAVTNVGTVLCWGYGSSGGVGDGTFADRLTPVLVRNQDGAGSFAANNWFLDLNPGISKTIPANEIPSFVTTSSGNAATAVVDVMANIQFRPQDVGHPVYVFGYVPSSLVQGAARRKDGTTCVLAQLTPSGHLQQVSASGLQAYLSNVTTTQGQAVTVLNSLSAAGVAGATFCVGTATSSSQAVNAESNVCVATVPANGASPCSAANSSVVVANVPGALSGLWWNPNESGWGIDFTQRGTNVFAAWYTYDAAGLPKWYVAPNCGLTNTNATSGSCMSPLYEVNGPTFFGTAFNNNLVHATQDGTLQVTFQDVNNATLTYGLPGFNRTVSIVRQVFPVAQSPAPAIDYTDLWWNPSESGWGMAITQQFSNIFLAWYVYDSTGKPDWYVAPSCTVQGNSCTGTLYHTTGPAFGPPLDPTRVQATAVGNAIVNFIDANNAVLSYTANGVSGTKTITRQLF